MSKEKYAKISSFFDIDDLFAMICRDVIHRDPIDIKRDLLGMKGGYKALAVTPINMDDIVRILKVYRIKHSFSLRIDYIDGVIPEPEEEVIVPEKDFLTEQVEDITNPELKDLAANPHVVSPVMEEKKINVSDIPDFE